MSGAVLSRQAGPSVNTRRVIVALSASTFVEWAGAGCVLPLLPLYLRKHGAPVALVGAAMAAFFFAAVFMQYPIGRLSDRLGRRPVQLGGLLTYTVASAAFAIIGTPIAALFVRSLQGVGAGVVDVANNATVGEIVPRPLQGRAYGAVFGSRTVGLSIGPVFGGLAGIAHMRWLFIGSALASLLACVPILLAVPKGRSRVRHAPAPPVVLWRDRSVLGVAIGYAATGTLIGVYEVCWSLLLHLRGASAWQIGLSWTLFAIPFAAMSLPGGWLVDHLDRRYLAAGATLVSAGFASAYPFLHSLWLLIGLGSLEAASVAVAGPALAAQLAHSVPGRQLGRAQGAASTAQTGATAIGALSAGALFALRPWVPFVGGASVIVVLVMLLAWCWRGVPGRSARPRSGPLEMTASPEAELAPDRARPPVPIEQAQVGAG
jgi:DHA1 family multidrug resistance protein-like MFS transporter